MYHLQPGKESSPGGCADVLPVMLLQSYPLPGQILQMWRLHYLVVPGDVVETQVVCDQQDNVGRRLKKGRRVKNLQHKSSGQF